MQFHRTILNGKQLAWDRATRAYAQGLAMLRLTCTILVWNKALLVGQNRMEMVRDWRRKTVLGLDSSDSDDTWSGGDEEVIAVRRMAREGLGPRMGRLPTEILNRIVRIVRQQAERRCTRTKETQKLETWLSALLAHERGLAKLCLTCRTLGKGLRAVAEGQRLMLEVASWRRRMRLKRRNSVSSDARVYESGVESSDGGQN